MSPFSKNVPNTTKCGCTRTGIKYRKSPARAIWNSLKRHHHRRVCAGEAPTVWQIWSTSAEKSGQISPSQDITIKSRCDMLIDSYPKRLKPVIRWKIGFIRPPNSSLFFRWSVLVRGQIKAAIILNRFILNSTCGNKNKARLSRAWRWSQVKSIKS